MKGKGKIMKIKLLMYALSIFFAENGLTILFTIALLI
jgi:hypothetical protein